jgi:Zn-dependent protease with chaperone function
MQMRWRYAAIAATLSIVVAGCSVGTTSAPPSRPTGGGPVAGPGDRASDSTKSVDPRQAARLQQVMIPLMKVMNHPVPPNQVKVGLIDSPDINAANAGPNEFYVTTGLLQRASDDQLRAVLAHEVAHADLGHVAKTQALGTGLSIGMIILDQIVPGTGAITPLVGQLAVNAYSRKEEYQADAHGVELLKRAGYDGKTLMANTLTWLQSTSGPSGGGFFATHPATGDRIEAVRRLP